jgi:putative ABC transport system substrate-binding protein
MLLARVLVLTFTLGLLAALAADAQQPGKVHRISFLLEYSSPDAASPDVSQALRKQLHELGYVEGQNIALESRWAQGRVERLPGLAAELVRLKVDVIVTTGTLATQAAKQATTTIPIVMVSGVDPVGIGLIASLARPGGNVTGVTSLTGELSGKRLELLKEAVPKASRLAVLWDPTNPSTAFELRETQVMARSLVKRVSIQAVSVRDPNEFESAFAAMTRERAGALIVLSSAMFFTERRRLANLAVKHRLPTMFGQREEAEAGGLMAYGANFTDLFQRAAIYVDKILRGAKPADLPVEQPTRYQLIINLKTAKALGLTIPQSVLIRADEVIQ